MTELYRHVGPDIDVPAGDIGVGAREIGYMFGQYKRITNRWEGVLTGKGREFGGSEMRPEATGYGAVYFLQDMLNYRNENIEGKSVAISGSGNVATHAAEKLIQLGAKVLTLSDSGGFIYEKNGFTAEQIDWVKQHKTHRRGRISEYAEEFPEAKFFENKKPWGVSCNIAMPCSTQNELDAEDAAALMKNGLVAMAEGANMPTTLEAVELFRSARLLYGPGKAANAGGVAVSGLEMSQNASRISWDNVQLDKQLIEIMRDVHSRCVRYGAEDSSQYVNYVKGANIAGFKKVADAMLSFGVV